MSSHYLVVIIWFVSLNTLLLSNLFHQHMVKWYGKNVICRIRKSCYCKIIATSSMLETLCRLTLSTLYVMDTKFFCSHVSIVFIIPSSLQMKFKNRMKYPFLTFWSHAVDRRLRHVFIENIQIHTYAFIGIHMHHLHGKVAHWMKILQLELKYLWKVFHEWNGYRHWFTTKVMN